MDPIGRYPFARVVLALAVMVLGLGRAEAAADEPRSLQDALNTVNQEQQAIFQQF